MKTIAIIQARMGSTRLPGKVLKSLAGDSVLGHVVRRVRAARRLDDICVATTEAVSDEPIVAECARLGVDCFRGSELDVLARYFAAAQARRAEIIVRVTSDCPFFDGALLDELLAVFHRAGDLQSPSAAQANDTERRRQAAGTGFDYLSNVQERRFPRGLDAEVFTFAALTRAHREATQPHEREHVTPYFYQHPERFRLHSFVGPADWSAHRWTLDTPADWQFITAVYGALGPGCTTTEVLHLLQTRPDLAQLNAHIEQKPLPAAPPPPS